MPLPAWQVSLPIIPKTTELRGVLGRKGSCAKHQLSFSSGFGCSLLLGSTISMASYSWSQCVVKPWLERLPSRIHLMYDFLFQCLLHIQCSSMFCHTILPLASEMQPCSFSFGKNSLSLDLIEEEASSQKVSYIQWDTNTFKMHQH